MEEIKKKKKLIYVSVQQNEVIERVCRENKNIDISMRFINEYNFTDFLATKTNTKTLSNVDFFVIDIRAIAVSTSNNEIIKCISQLRGLCQDTRIIFYAPGFKKGNSLLGMLFYKGVYNIITATSDLTFEEEFKEALTERGISFTTASKYEITDSVILPDSDSDKIVEKNYIRVKQDITVGVLGVVNHIGTTTVALTITNFLNSLVNINPCYIENNNHNDIIKIYKRNKNENEVEFLENIGRVKYKGLDLYYKPENIGEIKKEGYNFYIYDFGEISEMSDNDIASFLNKDVKIIIGGNCLWEEDKILHTFKTLKVNSEDESIYYLFNFVADEEKVNVLEYYEDLKDNIYFLEYQPNPFEIKNKIFLEKVFKKFLLNTSFETETKKKFSLFKNIRKKE